MSKLSKDELRAKMQANTPKPKRLGSDPFSNSASGLDLLITNTQDQPKPPTIQPTDLTKPKRGRPKEIHRTITKASQNGLHDGWTRATFIVKEDVLAKLKDRAYIDRRNLKDVVSEALEHYLNSTEPKEGK